LESSEEYRKIILECVERWLKEPDVFDHKFSPLDVLDPIFDKSGESAVLRKRGYITITPYTVNYEAVKNDRDKALSILNDLSKSESTKVVLRVLKILFKALNPPYLFKDSPDPKIYQQWLPEQHDILEIISNLVNKTTNSVIQLEICSNLKLFIQQQNTIESEKEIVEKAISIKLSIPDSFENRLVRALLYQYDHDWSKDFNEENREKDKRIESAAKEFLLHYDDPVRAYQFLEQLFADFHKANIESNPLAFFNHLGLQNYQLSLQLVKETLQNPDSALSPHVHLFLPSIRQIDFTNGMSIIREMLEKNEINMCRQLALGYSCNWWGSKIQQEDFEIIVTLVKMYDDQIKALSIKSLRFGPENLHNQAIQILLDVDIGNSEQTANAFSQIFDSKFGIPFSKLTNENLINLLSKLIPTKSLDRRERGGHGCAIRDFLKECGYRIPYQVYEFFIKRIEANETEKTGTNCDYEPLAFGRTHEEFEGIIKNENYVRNLRKIRDCLSKEKSGNYNYWISRLFADLSDGFCDESLNLLSEWIDSNDEFKIMKVGSILKNAHSDLLFTHSKFISSLIETAYRKNEVCYENVLSNLCNLSYSGGRHGTVGEPFPQDIHIRDSAMEIAKQFLIGSQTEKFYRWMSASAKKNIEYELNRDEEIGD
jgi:hypothetical protein